MKIISNIEKGLIRKIKVDQTSHFLINGNSIKILDKIKSNSIDLIITDPPYNVDLKYGSYYIDKMPWTDYFNNFRIWFKECIRVLNKKGSMYIISYPEINARILTLWEDEFKKNIKFRRWISWHYPTNIGHSRKNFTRSQRSILFFTKTNDYIFNRDEILQPYKNPEVERIKKLIEGGSKGRVSYCLLKPSDLNELGYDLMDVFEINLLKNISKDRIGSLNKNSVYYHPCQLPLSLLRIFVKVSSNPKNLLLDPFAGTFTLSKVAAELNRNSIGIEINPKYVNLGLERLKK